MDLARKWIFDLIYNYRNRVIGKLTYDNEKKNTKYRIKEANIVKRKFSDNPLLDIQDTMNFCSILRYYVSRE